MRQGRPALPATLEQQAGSARGVEIKFSAGGVDVGLFLFYFQGRGGVHFGCAPRFAFVRDTLLLIPRCDIAYSRKCMLQLKICNILQGTQHVIVMMQ